jgi:hypothetical protein
MRANTLFISDTDRAGPAIPPETGRAGRVLVLPFCALVLSCSEPHLDLPNDQIWTSPHFRYAARAGDAEVCSGVVDQLEAHLQTLTTYLGLPWTGTVIGYYKFRDLADYHSNSGCSQATDGCATPIPDVRSTWTLQGHELVHIYTRPLGSPPALFEEGLAEALSPEGRAFPAPSQSWRDILATPAKDGAAAVINYSAGGWFVTYLLREFGPAPFVAFYRAAALDHSAAAVAEQFQNVYGLNLDDVWSQAQASAPVLGGVPVWECASAEPIVMGGADARVGGGCDGRDTYAGLELPQPTTFEWSIANLKLFTISSCTADGWLRTEIPSTFGIEAGAVSLPAGKYYVAPGFKTKPSDIPQTIAFSEESGLLGPDCNAPRRLTLRPTQDTNDLILSMANTAVPWFAVPQIRTGKSVPMQRLPDNPYHPTTMVATVEVCNTCQGSCLILDSASELQVLPGMVLRFTNLTAPEGATVIRLSYSYSY